MKQKKVHYSLPYVYANRDRVELTVPPEQRVKLFFPYIAGAKNILELGCGKGLLGEQIRKNTNAQVYGVDISMSGIELAKNRGILAKIADLNKRLPFSDNFFDVVLSDQLLEHIYKTDYLLDEVCRILRPGGIVITITPNLSFWLNRILFLIGIYPIFLETGERSKTYGMKFLKKYVHDTDSQGHIHVFNRHALEDMFCAHGFNIMRVYGSPFPWQIPKFFQMIYNAVDNFFALFPSLARDIVLVAVKPQK